MRQIQYLRLLALMLLSSAPLACSDGEPTVPQRGAGTGGQSNTDAGADGACGKIDQSLANKDSADLFAYPTIPTFDMVLPEAQWENLKVHARDEQYVKADACFEGKSIGTVGLRFKGSYGSLYTCFDAAGNNTCRKLGMKVKFNEYTTDLRFYGLKKLNFQGYRYDDTYMKEHLSYDLYRAMGVTAPRGTWALMRVNGELQGLFGLIEDIDGRFTNNRWPDNGDQNLYKELWPGQTDDTWITQHLETNKDVADISAFKAFTTALNAAAPADLRATLGSYTDLDHWARYMAVDDAIGNFDGITTYYTSGSPDQAGNHNFFLYQESPTKFTIIPWDLESTLSLRSNFGSVPYWQTLPTDCSQLYLVWGGPNTVVAPGCNRVFQALAADVTSYRTYAQQLLDGPFAEDHMTSEIDKFAAFIRAQASVDPHGPGATTFEGAVSSLKQEIPNLRRRLQHLLAGTPSTPLLIDISTVTDFETADDYGIMDGTSLMSNPNTTTSVAVNASTPIDGAQSLKINFDFGNETTAWQQWITYRIPLASAPQDLTKLTGIRLKIRSDAARTVRFDINSPNNTQANKGINKGWDLSVTTDVKEISVAFADATVPSWAVDPNDSLTLVLQTASALTFQPICNGRDGTGALPAGVTDNGWVEIDDIQFY